MNNPIIFNRQEVIDRFRFHDMVHKLFNVRDRVGSMTLQISVELLSAIFKEFYPNNVLTDAIINNMLVAGGFITQEKVSGNELVATLDEVYFQAAPRAVKLLVYKSQMSETTRIRLNQYMLGKCDPTDLDVLNPTFIIQQFLKQFCILKDNNLIATFGTKQKVAADFVYQYYCNICALNGLASLPRRQFYDCLESLGYTRFRGYAGGKSGVTYFGNLFIPTTDDDLALSAEWRMGIVTNKFEKQVTSKGVLFERIDTRMKEEIIKKNKEVFILGGKSGTKKAEETEDEEGAVDSGRTDEAEEIHDSTTTSTENSWNDLGYAEGTYMVETDVPLLPEDIAGSPARTIDYGREETSAAHTIPKRTKSAGRTKQVEPDPGAKSPAAFDDGTESLLPRLGSPSNFDDDVTPDKVGSDPKRLLIPSIYDDDAEDGLDGDDERLGGDAVDSDSAEPELNAIAIALSVPCGLIGRENFTPAVMQEWINNMGLNIDATTFYSDIMNLIK